MGWRGEVFVWSLGMVLMRVGGFRQSPFHSPDLAR